MDHSQSIVVVDHTTTRVPFMWSIAIHLPTGNCSIICSYTNYLPTATPTIYQPTGNCSMIGCYSPTGELFQWLLSFVIPYDLPLKPPFTTQATSHRPPQLLRDSCASLASCRATRRACAPVEPCRRAVPWSRGPWWCWAMDGATWDGDTYGGK